MSFHDVQFPQRLARGSSGGPERKTDVVTLASGFEERNSPWAASRRRYNAGLAVATLDDLHAVVAFFEARQGRLHAFRFRDPIDHKSCAPSSSPQPTDQAIGTGTGSLAAFQLAKTYSSGGASQTRAITKPVAGTVRVAVAGAEKTIGTDFTVDTASGTITFHAGHLPGPGAAVTAGFEFDVPVRFDSDRLEINLAAFEAGDIPDIPLVEVRL